MNEANLRQIIYDQIAKSIESINDERVDKQTIVLSPETRLFGDGGELDSLELVSLVVDLEQELSDILNLELSLTDEAAMSHEISPFSSVGNLIDYIISAHK